MTKKYITISLSLLLSIPLFSQEIAENKGIVGLEKKVTYLDSIKNTFIKDDLAACVDNLWMKELTDLDSYDEMTTDITSIDSSIKVDFELPTELLKSRLEAMNAKSPFRIQYNENLENVIKSFLKYRRKSYERLMAVSEYYFPMFEEVFAKENIPLEIKYLAIVESALNPKAVSKMGATGLWQFMYQTGKQYDLKIDSYMDERSDPLKSTQATAEYMKGMYAIFGDWELVLASYNSGPGNVTKAIRRSGGKQNFWDIRNYLPKETQGYVPAFLATMYIYEYHKEHGIKPNRALLKQFATDTVMVKKQMTFKQISDLLEVPIAQLELLNPAYKLNTIPVYSDAAHYLKLPKDKIAIFASNEEKIYAYVQREAEYKNGDYQNPRAIALKSVLGSDTLKLNPNNTQNYIVKQGDNLNAIASKHNVSVEAIMKWNNLSNTNIAYGDNLKIGVAEPINKAFIHRAVATTTVVPKINNIDSKVDKEEVATNDDSDNEETRFHIVQKGESLNSIARSHNISVADLTDWNDLSSSNLQLGAKLKINTNAVSEEVAVITQPVILKNIQYVVQKGDNLGTIAKKFGASLNELKQWNRLNSTAVALGKTLIVAKNEPAINTSFASVNSFKKTDSFAKKLTSDYYVQAGDTLYSIAKKSGVSLADLKKWNDIGNEGIKPGMKLKLNG
ncbi:LysM peptidoglycan-binding domain-containing protein [Flavobacterium algicola]|uniref:LysM peptidoglycan-binding domain-containing protein n=1 Tax=Flavobacterium algicola TaxID=556529 RepID=UPI001EFD936C|nr:LysM peptidoglycan-binding domain-containing protein [Flavobacterium algicola]MCG9791993.1 LysM peptidoglycan-binding domain-containing protein [Flavobacterium algicola]